jgi:hypothetical protein
MTYNKVLTDLENSLNGTLNKDNSKVFLKSIKTLKEDFKKNISTRFLRDLMKSTPNREKTRRINYLLRKSGLTTKKTLRENFKEWVLNSYITEIKSYAFNQEGQVYLKDFRNQEVGKLSLQNKSEVLHFVEVF